MFATTSGTTGSAKYIPVTPSYLHEYSHGVHVHTYRMFTDYRDILDGKMLVPSSNDVEGHTERRPPVRRHLRLPDEDAAGPIKRFYALPYELAKVKHVESKYYLTLRHAMPADVRLIMMPNPSSLLILAEKMAAYADELIDGHPRRHGEPGLPPGGSAEARSAQAPSRTRGAPTSSPRSCATSGRLSRVEVWPNLRLLSLLEGRDDAALPRQAAGGVRRRARPRPRLHGERGPRLDAARQLGRRRRAQRDEPLLRVRAGGAARLARTRSS